MNIELCTNMASSETDAVFKRALRLLHSKSKNSEEQLRMMLDDAIKQRYGVDKTLTNYINKKELSNKGGSPRKTRSGGRWKEDHKNTDSEKLSECGSGESSQELPSIKKKSDSDVKKSSHSKQLVQSSTVTAEKLPLTSVRETDDHEEEDLALEMMEDDLRCVICRGMDIGARNQMVECAECKSLYHQECHQPPVAHTEINDPRSAWYCASCTEAINKRDASSNTLEKLASGLNLIGAIASHSGDMKPTIATSATKSSSPSSSRSKTVGSMSQVSTKTLRSSSSSTKSVELTSSSSKLVSSNISMINAEKKLQIMKKKATKQQEKRKHSN